MTDDDALPVLDSGHIDSINRLQVWPYDPNEGNRRKDFAEIEQWVRVIVEGTAPGLLDEVVRANKIAAARRDIADGWRSRAVKAESRHVCGAQGFGRSPDDWCPACSPSPNPPGTTQEKPSPSATPEEEQKP